MNDSISDVIIHVNENLNERALQSLEDAIREDRGVVAIGHNPKRPHLIMLAYDSTVARSTSVMHQFQKRGLHAQLVGL